MENQDTRGVLNFAKLSGSTNYREWKTDVEMLLRERGVHGFIDDTETAPAVTATAKEKNEFLRRKDRALSTIYLSLDVPVKPLLAGIVDPKEAWTILGTNFEPSSKAMVGRLLTEFYGAKMSSTESMSVYIARLKDLVRRLKNANCEIKDLHVAYKMISGLPEKFNVIVQQLYQLKDADFTSDAVSIALLAEDGRLQN